MVFGQFCNSGVALGRFFGEGDRTFRYETRSVYAVAIRWGLSRVKLRPLLLAILFSLAYTPYPTKAQDELDLDASSAPDTSVYQNYDTSNFTYSFADMGPIQSSGSFDYPGAGQISYSPGARPEELFTVGMFRNSFSFQNLSIEQIGQTIGQPLGDAALSEFPLVQRLTTQQLVDSIPGLAQTPLNQVPPIQAIAQQQGVSGGGSTVGSVASVLQGPVGQLGGKLVNYGISQIPGLDKISLDKLPGIDIAKISDIPGLSQFPLINPLSIKDWFVPFDVGYGMSSCGGGDCHERNIDNTASGNLKNMSIPCMGARQSCAHIEVRRWGPDATNKIRWISKEQLVPGGDGFLCDEEPTGRFPLGKNPKVVLEKINEASGSIEFALYFSVEGPDGQESAHCFGPFPMLFFGSANEGNLILFGPDTVPKKSPFASIGQAAGFGSSSGSGGDYSGTCVASDGKTSATYKGVNIAAFKNSISNVESRGTGGYKAIGDFVNDGAGNTGRGLGKYQFMSYGPAKDLIMKKPGGLQFLAAVNSPNLNKDNFAALTEQLFTPAEQESLMDDQIRHLADVGAAQGLTGDRLIERMAEMHEGGEGSRSGIDQQYSDSVLSSYKTGGTCVSGDGVATGKLRWPTKDPYITSGFGYRISPGGIGSTYHAGIDLAGQVGDPIMAADGGIVTFAGWDVKGCGYMVAIDHKNGYETKYCHTSKMFVTQGSKVSAGQHIANIGSTGNSTGPHLHFTLKRNDKAVDPTPYLRGK
jgi:murein DD-endopeptidase MepM/ murein hydrolase activator NlpD